MRIILLLIALISSNLAFAQDEKKPEATKYRTSAKKLIYLLENPALETILGRDAEVTSVSGVDGYYEVKTAKCSVQVEFLDDETLGVSDPDCQK